MYEEIKATFKFPSHFPPRNKKQANFSVLGISAQRPFYRAGGAKELMTATELYIAKKTALLSLLLVKATMIIEAGQTQKSRCTAIQLHSGFLLIHFIPYA